MRETESTQPVLSVRDLEYRYTKAAVWSDVSFSLAAGELAALYGSNGSGKSTLFRCLAGWAQPTQGSIDVSGVPFNGVSRSIRRSIAYVPDVPTFYDDLTGREHVRFVAAANRSPAALVSCHGEARGFSPDYGFRLDDGALSFLAEEESKHA